MASRNDWVGKLVTLVQDAFLDTPQLRLTLAAAEKRFGMCETTCEAVLETLVDAGVLARTQNGAYLRYFPQSAVVGDAVPVLAAQQQAGRGQRRLATQAA